MYPAVAILSSLLHLLADVASSALSDSDASWVLSLYVLLLWGLYGIAREWRRGDLRRKWGVSPPSIDKMIAAGDFAQAQQILEKQLRKIQRWKGKNSAEARQQLMQLGRLHFQIGDFDDAEATFARVLAIEEATVGHDSLDLTSTLHWIARTRYERNNHAGSLELWQRVLNIREKHLSNDHIDVAFTLNEMGKVLSFLGRYEEAEEPLLRAMAICERSGEPAQLAAVMRSLAWTFLHKGRLDEAEAAFRKALTLIESSPNANPEILAERHADLAAVLRARSEFDMAQQESVRALQIAEGALHGQPAKLLPYIDTLASLAYQQAKYAEAESYLRRLADLQQEIFDDGNLPPNPVALENLSLVLRLQKKFPEAEELQRQALAIREQIHGVEHEQLPGSLEQLSLCLISQEKFADAQPLLRRSVQIRERATQPETPELALALYNLAYVLKRTGDPSGEPLLWRALNIEEKALGPQHPRLAVTLDALAQTRLIQGDAAGAETLFRQALDISEKAEGTTYLTTVPLLRSLALLLRTRKSFGECENLLRRILLIVESNFGERSSEQAAASVDLANLLHETGNLPEAEALYRRAISIFDLNPERDGSRAAISTGALANLMERTGDYVGAKLLYESAVAKSARVLGPDHPSTLQIKQRLDTLMLRLADPHIN